MRDETSKADALGIAHMMRTGWFRGGHIKSEESYRLRLSGEIQFSRLDETGAPIKAPAIEAAGVNYHFTRSPRLIQIVAR